MKNLINYSPKNQTKVDGKMSEEGADRAGLVQAITSLILAVGFIITAIILALK